MHGSRNVIFLAPLPGGLGRGQKVKYHLISITKSISKIFIPNFVSDKQNRMQVTFSSYGQTGDLGARSKGQISLTCQFQNFLYQTLCVCSHKLKIENILNRIFILLPESCPGLGLVGAGGSQKL